MFFFCTVRLNIALLFLGFFPVPKKITLVVFVTLLVFGFDRQARWLNFYQVLCLFNHWFIKFFQLLSENALLLQLYCIELLFGEELFWFFWGSSRFNCGGHSVDLYFSWLCLYNLCRLFKFSLLLTSMSLLDFSIDFLTQAILGFVGPLAHLTSDSKEWAKCIFVLRLKKVNILWFDELTKRVLLVLQF